MRQYNIEPGTNANINTDPFGHCWSMLYEQNDKATPQKRPLKCGNGEGFYIILVN